MKKSKLLLILLLFTSCSTIRINGIEVVNRPPKGPTSKETALVIGCCMIGAYIGNNVINGK